jgi:hypothetical protein
MICVKLVGLNRNQKADLLKFIIILSLFWLLAYAFLYPEFRFKYYSKNNEEFLSKFEAYTNSSLIALNQLKAWLKKSNDLSLNKSTNKVIFNRSIENGLCVGILHKNRYSIGRYYHPLMTLSSILTRVKLKYQDRILVSIIDVEGYTKSDEMDPIKDLIHINYLSLDPALIRDLSIHHNKVKEAHDYINIMRYYYSNYNKTCKYVLLIEDDSVACENWYEKVEEAIKYLNENKLANSWYCLKFFTSFRFFDWLVHSLTVFKFLLTIIALCLVKYLIISKTSSWSRFKKFCVLASSCMLSFWIYANSVSPLGYGVHKFTIGFNAVANLYPISVMNQIANFIQNRVDHLENFEPKDILMKRFKNFYNYDEYIVEPALFQHLGLQSSMSLAPVDLKDAYTRQYRPFQSYSFIKEYDKLFSFNPDYSNS